MVLWGLPKLICKHVCTNNVSWKLRLVSSFCSSLKLQKRLAASVMRCGKKKVWLDPNEINEIANTNSSKFKSVSFSKLVWILVQ
jgi:hypothetical protein